MKALLHLHWPFAAASLLGLAFLGAHAFWTADTGFLFLFWNLGLAWLPVVLGEAVIFARSGPLRGMTALAWLLAYPNGPYLATDLVHLRVRGEAVWWGDVALLGFFAGLGGLLACLSLFRIHGWLRQRLPGWAGWCAVAGICLLSGLGMYLGRFLRWSSWDVFREPVILFGGLAERALAPWEHPRMLAFVLTWALVLLAGYGMVFALARFARQSALPAAGEYVRGGLPR